MGCEYCPDMVDALVLDVCSLFCSVIYFSFPLSDIDHTPCFLVDSVGLAF